MRSRELAVLGCLVLVVLGSGAALADPGGTFPARVPAESADTSAVADDAGQANDSLPPGVTENGVANATVLVTAHRTALNETGFVSLTRASYNAAAFGVASNSTTVGVVGRGLSPFRSHATGTITMENRTRTVAIDQWGNDSVLVARYATDNRTRYLKQYLNRTRGPRAEFSTAVGSRSQLESGLTGSRVLLTTLRSGRFRVASTETAGGRTLTTLRAAGVNDSGQFGSANVSRYNATVVADAAGRVHSLSFTVVVEERGQRMRLHQSFELLGLGPATPLEPTWTARALDTVTADVSIDDADGYFVLRNERGDPLPAGSTVELEHDNATHTLELGEALAPGQSRYIYYPDGADAPVLADRPPENASDSGLSGEYEFVVRTPDGRTLVSASFGYGSANASVAGPRVGLPVTDP